MSRLKAETLSIRTTDEIKQLLRFAAERERRSLASMVEILVLEHARQHSLQAVALSLYPPRQEPRRDDACREDIRISTSTPAQRQTTPVLLSAAFCISSLKPTNEPH